MPRLYRPGSFLRVPLVDGSFGYGRVLKPPHDAYYDYCPSFDTAGNERSAEPQECVGLERLAVWEEENVEERLLDTFMGRPNARRGRPKTESISIRHRVTYGYP
ncbi:immunity 26/phosphotriesterase HocA family protein [Hyalangium versicolor]|uniref:immunity 26/phosphotriesterase HocA family protein n=1 Tax=Hyalangium versicolor TaxID=2861190 RepID=UPI001CC8F2C0|nr:immunity 26/phosphotriesterase HocA family protein [Hyalangium versicolor]